MATDGLLVTRYSLRTARHGGAGHLARLASALDAMQLDQTISPVYLTGGTLDADNDGQPRAITDGLLIVRALLGLSGTALTAGASNAQHSERTQRHYKCWIWIRTYDAAPIACL